MIGLEKLSFPPFIILWARNHSKEKGNNDLK